MGTARHTRQKPREGRRKRTIHADARPAPSRDEHQNAFAPRRRPVTPPALPSPLPGLPRLLAPIVPTARAVGYYRSPLPRRKNPASCSIDRDRNRNGHVPNSDGRSGPAQPSVVRFPCGSAAPGRSGCSTLLILAVVAIEDPAERKGLVCSGRPHHPVPSGPAVQRPPGPAVWRGASPNLSGRRCSSVRTDEHLPHAGTSRRPVVPLRLGPRGPGTRPSPATRGCCAFLRTSAGRASRRSCQPPPGPRAPTPRPR